MRECYSSVSLNLWTGYSSHSLSLISLTVYIVIAELGSAIDLARQLYAQHGNKSLGGNVIISIDKDQYASVGGLQRHCVKPHEPKNVIASNTDVIDGACESLFILTPALAHRDDNFTSIVHNYSASEPFNAPLVPSIKSEASAEAIYAYDAVQVLATALTRAYNESKSNTVNGSQVMKHLLGRQYQSVLGYTQRIDENGDADGNYDFITFKKGIGMMRIARFDSDNCQPIVPGHPIDLCFRYINETVQVEWPGGLKPIDEPECGLQNEYCDEMTNWVQLIFLAACFVLTSIAIGFTIK